MMSAMSPDQLTRAVKSVAAQNKKQGRNLWIAIAFLAVLTVLMVVAIFMSLNTSMRIADSLAQQRLSGTQDALLTRCIAVVDYEGVDNPRNYESVVDFCIMDRKCSLENPNPTASAECVDRNFDATHEAELRNSPYIKKENRMSKSKMQAAKELIQDKRYAEARKILASVDHPIAREWEAKLAKIAPHQPVKQSSGKKFRIILLIAGLLFLAGVAIFTILDNQRIARNIQAINDQAASDAYKRDQEYCIIHYNDNPQAYDQCGMCQGLATTLAKRLRKIWRDGWVDPHRIGRTLHHRFSAHKTLRTLRIGSG